MAYRFSQRLGFLPWVGRDYDKGVNDRRLLVIGESHYSGSAAGYAQDRLNRYLTHEVLERQWNGECYSYYTKLVQAIAGIELDKQAFWRRLAFYNFVQEIVSIGAGVRPTDAHWQKARKLLPGVIETLQPDCIVATGKELWDQLPENWPEDRPLHFEGRSWPTCTGRTLSGKRFRATYINHPSSVGAGSGLRWHPLIKGFLALPKP